jgi:hypothetical protein
MVFLLYHIPDSRKLTENPKLTAIPGNTPLHRATKLTFLSPLDVGCGPEEAVSRILFLRGLTTTTGGNHLSRTPATWRLVQPTRRLTGEQPASRPASEPAIPPVRSCSEWGLPSQLVAQPLVSSYLTISPLPGTSTCRSNHEGCPYMWRCRAVCFYGTFLEVTFTGR